MATSAPDDRFLSLDVIRGVAVMGILAANLPAFALPEAAYFSPLAAGGSTGANAAVWFATYVLVEGKMRGLFTFLFGASMLLVIDRAAAAGDDPATVHFRRMATLFVIGCLHLYLFWWGDILSHYALVGALAYLFRGLPVRWLIGLGVAFVGVQLLADTSLWLSLTQSAARATAPARAVSDAFAASFGVPSPATLAADTAAARGGFVGGIAWRWGNELSPVAVLPLLGPQTLSAMLFGMAGYRSGFLTGRWPRARYRRWAAVCLGLTLPVYVALAINTLAHDYAMPQVFLGSILAAEPLRPIMVAGYAAALILLIRADGWLTRRIAAVGRAAFTNYLGTTLVMSAIFYGWGFGQFGHWPRAALYLLAPIAWLAMLAWSTPWLARYRYGPMEWLWRSLARLRWQPMRRPSKAMNGAAPSCE